MQKTILAMPFRISFSLRTKLTLAFLFVAAVPVALLGLWVEESAVRKEFASVKEKHLLIAHNLSAAMERYVADLAAVTDAAASDPHGLSNWGPVLTKLEVQSAVRVHDGTQTLAWSDGINTPDLPLPAGALVRLRHPRAAQIGLTRFSDLTRVNDTPVFLLASGVTADTMLVFILSTRYLVKLQQSIAFGERGHSMMVDARGHVIAHPNPQWQRISKDASKLSVVQKMMRGETGVSQFYSPPMQADMIAGHTAVDSVGWGVMVPQPVAELYERASDVQRLAVIIAFAGLAGAGLLGWWLARRIAIPLETVRDSLIGVQSAAMKTKIAPLPRSAILEAHQLVDAFNAMITRLNLSHAEVLDAKAAAEHANHAKSSFLANMSHELRTPLHGILSFAELSVDEAHAGNGKVREQYARHILSSGEVLLALVESLLDLAKLESGHQQLDLEDTSPNEMVKRVGDELAPVAAKKNVSLEFDGHAERSFHVDNLRMQQVVRNLLANAIRFSPDNSTVTVTLNQSAKATCISVADQGPGIPEQELEEIFHKFVQSSATVDGAGGTGLGLAIAREIVGAHGGRIWAENGPGGGARFSVELPDDGAGFAAMARAA